MHNLKKIPRLQFDLIGPGGEQFPEALLRVEDAIIDKFEISRELLRAETRSSTIVRARHLVWFVARDALGLTFTRIARLYDKDHTTIVHGVDKIAEQDAGAEAYQIIARHDPELSKMWG